jgi:DNA-binding GntR family transcriptional regulator
MIPGKGTFVAQLTKKQIDDLLSIRELLESLSIQLAATLRTQEDLEKIEYILYKQEQSFTGQFKSQQDFLTFDSEFHCLIAEISQNKYLEKQLLQILNNCRRYLNATTIDIIMPDVLKEHKELYEQIKNQDVEKAKLYMQKHIDNIRTRMIENLNYDDIK